MKKTSIFYFSGTGNTWWAAGILQDRLLNLGLDAERISIEQPRNTILGRIESSDILIIAYPIYGSDRPEVMKDFIENLPKTAKNTPCGIFCTQLAFSGDGAWLEHEKIEEKGYRIDWTAHIKMPNNICIPGFPFGYTNDHEKLKAVLRRAEKKIESLAQKISRGEAHLQGRSAFSRVLGQMQRKPYRRMFSSFQAAVGINRDRCTRCGKCISLCPSGNLAEGPDGYPDTGRSCNLCLRCYNFCPASAVQYSGKDFKAGKGSRRVPYRGPVAHFDPRLLKK